MASYIDSPQYQALVAQVLKGGSSRPQYPGEAGLNFIGDMAQALQLKNMTDRGEASDAAAKTDSTNAYATALSNLGSKDNSTWDVGGGLDASGAPAPINVSPAVNASQPERYAAALRGSPELTKEMGPTLAKQLAPTPISPFQQAELDQRDAAAKEQGRQFDFQQLDHSTDQVNKALDTSFARDQQRQTQRFQADENEKNRQSRADAAAIRAGGVQSNVQSVQPLGDGTLLKVFRDGHTELTKLDGTPVAGAKNDPKALFNQAAAGAAGKAAGTAAEALPTTQANFDIINQTLDAFNDPAVRGQAGKALGFGGLLPTIPGVNSDFKSRVDQLQGQTFLQAFNTLRGGGQITEVEGAKATNAIARLQKAQTPDEFYSALREAKQTFGTLFQAAKTRGGRGAVVPALQGGAAPAPGGGIDDLVNQYKTKTP